LVATSGFNKKKIAMLNEFTNQLQHFKFADRVVRIGVIKDFKANEREPDNPQCEYLITMTEKTFEVADFTYLTVS
jgi:hypothetical protein